MNEHESRELATHLFAVYFPKGGWREDTFEFYEQLLGQLPRGVAEQTIERLVNRSTSLPRPAEIRLEIAEAELGLPTAAEAWEQAMLTGVERHPLVTKVMAYFGGSYNMRTDDEPGILRAQFIKAFDEERRRELGHFDLRDVERLRRQEVST